ncbi:MAG: MarR family transcriptional regulator [Chloroflexi bacterium]|nr:MarR family transcriptional regulator [Chloroflexota bacterium]
MAKSSFHDPEARKRWRTLVQSLNPDIEPTAFQLVGELRMVAHALTQIGESSLTDSGMSYAQYRVLMSLFFANHVGGHTELNPSEISEKLGVSRNTISSLIRNLETDEFIERKLDKQDRRKFNISLTTKGDKLVQKYTSQHMRTVANCFIALTTEEQDQLSNLLNKLSGHIHTAREQIKNDK